MIGRDKDGRFNSDNKFAEVNRKYRSRKKMESAIDEYFKSGISAKIFVIGVAPYEREVKVEMPTITELAHYLGFESRQSIYAYELDGRFSYIIKRARLKIEINYEQRLHLASPTGAIFALKNMGWSDKSEIAHKGVEEGPPIVINLGAGIKPENEAT